MTADIRCFQVPPEAARIRLDRYLSIAVPDQSRSQIQIWIRNGLVLVNNTRVKSGHPLKPGDIISLTAAAAPAESLPQPEDMPIAVIYEDADLAVVDKPAGMVCHSGAGVRSGTMVNALLFRLGSLPTGDALRPGIVHRLDKLTSGLLVVAKSLEAHRALSLQFRNRKVKKEYLALVYGRPPQAAGTIRLALGRDLRNRKKISVHTRKRREAVTHYQVEKVHGPFSLLRVRIETGRTHQIRVHLAQIGNPVVGDNLYGGNRCRNLQDASLRKAAGALARFFLHAHRLEFDHPRTGSRLSFHAPLPPELADFLASVSQG